ncbi:MAG: hypothetical protein B7Y25_06080 [Alphaproteobacteria bacterium 16-39-46]|nr:MAG: hypothetical protein B7Y25_06080 [Alphaproteobacteria bacterium 16-39-46]OZA42085.1 MAG: hypothetical protein B7X84_06920 [Alphaproteobacteria bacterium 17-39-52]HQS84469.1 NB-ARC domain-containing protein [Alphaproteobacteria bacterium]HQS94397.1 NB-ARC domain-containing protein [Alphaproteobacteria bacterium]
MFFYSIQLKRKIYALFCFGLILSALAFLYKESYKPAYVFKNVKADLVIPKENTLLKRPQLLSQIEEKNKTNETSQKIDVIALVGEKGSGKTVLARYYGYSQHDRTVWELNAETKETLARSFRDFAYSLAETKSEKEELLQIETIENPETRNHSLFSFVRKILKEQKNWLLIYDNVTNFSEIENYFPQDETLWGGGKVILVTRDENIKNTSYIKPEDIIKVGELQKEEALTLFSSILFDFFPQELDLEKKEEALRFLNQIPRFPLDVSIAARYIKNGKISYEKYLDLLNQKDPAFERLQKMFVVEASDYFK